MTQNEIDIIKREVAARLPYGVKVNVNSTIYKDPMTVLGIDYSKELVKVGENIGGMFFTHTERVADVKPYLRPMDSMTDDERKELPKHVLGLDDDRFEVKQDGGIETVDPNNLSYVYFGAETTTRYIDWLNQRMFDYRGLIPKNLALTAPEDMYDFSNTDESCNK